MNPFHDLNAPASESSSENTFLVELAIDDLSIIGGGEGSVIPI